jgi:23S rRNA (guanosine2251-2'-O)-methyltransferase
LQKAGDEELFIIVCDGLEDEGNLGAVIRTAEAAGAHGVVIPKRRSAGLSPVTARASAGAAEHIPIVRVPGIPSFLREIKSQGVWIYGAAGEAAENALETRFNFPAALVLGGEEDGLHRLTRELCDKLVALPMRGKTASLNVSCAAAVLIYKMRFGG